MASSQTDPPEDVPEELIAVLQNSADSQLREIINYAQQLLSEHPPITDAVELHPDEPDEARRPFAYRVKWKPNIEDEGGRYRWHYLGKVHDDSGDGRND